MTSHRHGSLMRVAGGVAVVIVLVLLGYWAYSMGRRSAINPASPPHGSSMTVLNTNSSDNHQFSVSPNKTDAASNQSAADQNNSPAYLNSADTASAGDPSADSDVAAFNLDGTLAKPKSADKNHKKSPFSALSGATLASSSNSSDLINTVNPSVAHGMSLIANGKWVKGRKILSKVLFTDKNLSPADAQTIRDTLTSVNKQLVFSDKVYSNDPLEVKYKVQSGDLLARIAPRYNIPYQFIARINHVNPRTLRAGQTIKIIKGPFNARVIKHLFLIDVYLNAPDGLPVYVCSFPVGLGKDNATPVGKWIIKSGGKVQNPGYTNPRTGKYIKPDDPENPVGEYWMSLEGVGKNTKGLKSYGIHGTIDQSSIGHEDSMGCIRVGNANIKHLFHMLVDGQSKVEVLK